MNHVLMTVQYTYLTIDIDRNLAQAKSFYQAHRNLYELYFVDKM